MDDFSKHLNLPLDQKEITLLDAISLNFINSDSPPLSLHELPSYMLRRIMLLDTASRDLPNITNNLQGMPDSAITDANPLSSFLDEDEDERVVHPMDVFLFLFVKSHPIFRQTLVNQVSKCQLSLPLITQDSVSNVVTYNHFAFQTLILSRYVDDENTKTFSAVEEPLPIISFIRVANCESSQKSEFLDRILKIKHDYFFHKNSNGNTKKRYFLNGTVEIAWYLSKSKKNNIINNHYIMLNLRGDACQFPKQRTFIGKISKIVYVFVPFSELTQEIAKHLVEIHDTFKAKVIYLIYKGDTHKNPCPECIPNILNDKQISIGLKKKNTCQNIELIEKSISQCLDLKYEQPPLTLTECINIATNCGILSDVFKEDISSNQKLVESICKDFPLLPTHIEDVSSCNNSLAQLKRRLLPLQGKFGEWAEANRELQKIGINKGRSYFEEYRSNVKDARLEARTFQINQLSKPSILLLGILKQCARQPKDSYGFFLFWDLLKNYLNAVSRKHLPILYTEYKKWLVESYSVQSNSGDLTERDAMQQRAKINLIKTAEWITQSSFGIEHIFREIGQSYEAFLSIHDSKKKALLKGVLDYRPTLLPGVMARLILHGHSFEIVNGDDNHVPLQWVTDVLSSLSDIIGADKKIFVISVLGIQSSGKSTLLNTMFGINFPVSSGRCTRGVFMQMIEVNQSLRKELGYDYLVLLDTEGLRAPELSGSLSYKRDNEMATFIVGLGDIAVINIKGESHSEVQDILEITVIAFIRMKLTYAKPRCLFVHQNVGDIQAKTNLMIARKNLIDTLNEMTLCAAQQENKELQFCQFYDVIKFNPEKDVFYFPGLFEGEPPMTSIAPSYIERAEELRSNLITCCPNENRLTLKQWRKKLSNLWNSVLNENFVFSYRNILELNCRVELDIALCSWYSHFAQEMAAIKSEYFNELSNVENHQLSDTLGNILNSLIDIIENISSELEQRTLKKIFVQHEKKEIFQQWSSQTEIYFKSCREREYKKVKEECDTISKVEKQKHIIDENFAAYRKDIVSKVRDLYEHNKDKGSFESADSVNIYFDDIWKEWLSQIQLTNIDCADIPRDLQQVLVEIPHLQQLDVISEKRFIIKDIKKYEEFGMSEFEEMVQIYGETHGDYNYYEKIDRQTQNITFGTKVKKFFRLFTSNEVIPASNKSDISKMQSIITHLDGQINNIIGQFPPNSNYCIDYFQVLVDKSVKAITEHNKTERSSAKESLILTNHFIFDFVFYQCCKAIKKFEILQEKFMEQNSLELKLVHLESILSDNFSQLCAGIHSEGLCAKLLTTITLNGMRGYLQDTILQFLHNQFVSDLEHGTIYTSRASLQLAVLKDLARMKDFQAYIRYIRYPFDYINSFIQRDILKFSEKPSVVSNILNNLETKIRDLKKIFIEATQPELSQQENHSWEEWKLHYHKSISKYVRGVKLSDLEILDIHCVSNYKQFSDLFSEAIEDSCKEFDWRKWIQEILTSGQFNDLQDTITNTLIECEALCPFCREPCQLTAGEHEHYCGSFHRPQGISGWRYETSRVICTEECTTNVQLDRRFLYREVWYRFSDYRTVDDNFKSWKILGQDSIESKYWQWVLYIFHDEFVNHYGMERNEKIDRKWAHLTEEEVLDDIEKHYQNYIFKTIK